MTKITLWQMDDAAGSIGKMEKKKKWKESSAYVFCETSLTWDAIPSLEAEQAWVPLQNRGRVYTGVPFIKHILKVLLCGTSG